VVPADQGHAIWISDFEAEKEQEGFQRVEPAVDEVAHEQVIRVWHVAAYAEQFHQVVELPVDVTADGDRGIDRDDISFFDEQLACLVTQFADLGLGDQAAGPQLLDRPV
jgi:hypothetical protein